MVTSMSQHTSLQQDPDAPSWPDFQIVAVPKKVWVLHPTEGTALLASSPSKSWVLPLQSCCSSYCCRRVDPVDKQGCPAPAPQEAWG